VDDQNPFYVVVIWQPASAEDGAEVDEVVRTALSLYDPVYAQDRTAFIPLYAADRGREIYGAMRYVAARQLEGKLGFLMSPVLRAGSDHWNGRVLSGFKWTPINDVTYWQRGSAPTASSETDA
jgi:hypothetical protein